MLPALLLALPQIQAPVSLHHFPADAPGRTWNVDTTWVEEANCYAVAHDSLAGNGHTFVAFTRVDAYGSPLTSGELLLDFPPDHELTAGPVVADGGIGTGAALALAYAVDERHYLLTLYLDPTSPLGPDHPLEFHDDEEPAEFELRTLTDWRVTDARREAHDAPLRSIAIGANDLDAYTVGAGGQLHPSAVFTVAAGDADGDVWAWRYHHQVSSLAGGQLLGGERTWVDEDPERFDSSPSIPRAANGLVVWQVGGGQESDVVARPFDPFEGELGGRIDVFTDPERSELQPYAAGDEDQVLVATRVLENDLSSHAVVALKWNSDSGLWSVEGPSQTLAGPYTLSVSLSDPTLAMTAPGEFVHAMHLIDPDLGPAVLTRPFRFETLATDVPVTFVPDPALSHTLMASEHPRGPFGHALVVWPGAVPPISEREARGARVQGLP